MARILPCRNLRSGRSPTFQKKRNPLSIKQAEKLEGASLDALKIFGSARALPSRKPLAIRYSLFAIRRRFGFNWRVMPPHDRNLNKFGCSGEQLSSLIPTRPKFFGTAEPCPPEKPSATRHSLFATRCRFGSAGASSSHFSRPSSHALRSVESQHSCSVSSTTG